MRERTETVHTKGHAMDLSRIIRILEVPASVPAETAPAPVFAPGREQPTRAPEPSRAPGYQEAEVPAGVGSR
jgi:hypothetical protein